MTDKKETSDIPRPVEPGVMPYDWTAYEIYAQALDHIAKIAEQAQTKTTRLTWIAARARLALAGKPYDYKALPKHPKNRLRHNAALEGRGGKT